MVWVWMLLAACGADEIEGLRPADLLPLDEDGRAWVYESTPACGCAEEGTLRVHTLEAGEPAVIHTALDCGACGELTTSAWLVSAGEETIEAWGHDSLDGDARYDPPVAVEDGEVSPGSVLSTETGATTWLSELVAWEACPAEVVGAQCARYQVQALDGGSTFPAGTWWLAEGEGIVAFTEGRGADEAEWVLVDSR